jgi:oligoendopeptidase F
MIRSALSSRRHLQLLSSVMLAAVAITTVAVSAQERDRAKIPDKYKWNLADIYPSEEAWRKTKDQLVREIPELRSFRGTLAQSAGRLADALEMVSRLNKELSRAFVYASMLSDQDTRVSKYQGMQQEMIQVASQLGEESAYIEPEILKTERATIDRFVTQEPRLKIYKLYLDDIQRRRPHTKSDGEEKLLASSVVVTTGPSAIFGVFADADFPYPTVTLSDGKTTKLDTSTFSTLRALPNREDRKKVMSAFFGELGKYRGTFGATLNSQIQSDVFVARARDYKTSLEAALDGPNLPTSVYTRLVDGVNKHLPTFHRYLKLRQKMMGLPELHYYDLYAPLVASVDVNYTPEEAQKHVLAALKPLGPDYTGVIERAYNERWIDLLPNEGKRSGAYSNGGAYDVHPFMLINYNGKYTDVSTLAHELGHTMQSYYSNKAQPFATSNYPIFVAEVASTFNEALLIDYMLKNIKDNATKLSLLGTISRASRAPCSGRRSSRSSSCARTRWRRKASRSRASPSTSSTRTSRRSITATTRASWSSTTTSRTSGRSFPTSIATTTSSSTRPPSRRRRRCRKRCWPAIPQPRSGISRFSRREDRSIQSIC